MVMQKLASSNKVMKFIMFGILMMASLGLVMMDVGGFFRSGGVSSNDVAKVGHETISLSSFDRNLRRTLGRIGIGANEAYKMGYVDQVLAGEMRSRLLDQVAHAHDITISRKHVAAEVQKIVEPMAQGRDPGEVLKQILVSQGMTEHELTDSIRREISGGLMASSVQNSFISLSADLTHDLYLSQNEMRDVEYIVFADKDVRDIPAPTEENLKTAYEMTKESFAIPETRVLQLIRVKDDNLKKTLDITDEELKDAYESNIDVYSTPAMHRIEMVVLPSDDLAQKIHEAAKAGAPMKKAAQDAGQLSAYLGEQDAIDTKIPPEFKDKVLVAKDGDLIGPVKSDIGFHIVKVVKAMPASVKPFDSVKKEIKDDMYETKLSDQKYALANEVDDMLAGGSTPEDVAGQAEVEITTLPTINSFGQTTDKQDALKTYDKTGSVILETGFNLADGETSPVSEMADGTFTAIHVKSVTPKTYKPFEDVRKQIENNWKAEQSATANHVAILNYISQIGKGKTMQQVASESGRPLKTIKGITRKSELQKPLNEAAMGTIFSSAAHKPLFIGTDLGFAVAYVSDISWPEKVDTASEDYKKFKDALSKDTQNEAIMTFIQNKTQKYKTVVNNELLQRAYTPQAQDDGSQ